MTAGVGYSPYSSYSYPQAGGYAGGAATGTMIYDAKSGGFQSLGSHGASPSHESEGGGGLFGLAKSFVKGATGGFLSKLAHATVLDENGHFSLGKTLKTAVIAVGLGAASVAFPPLGVGLAAYGLAKGGIGMANGLIDAKRAYDMGDYYGAEQAAYNAGSSATGGAVSAIGLRAAVGASQAARGATAAEKSGSLFSRTATELKQFKPGSTSWNNASSKIDTFIKPASTQTTAATANSADDAAAAVTNQADDAAAATTGTTTAKALQASKKAVDKLRNLNRQGLTENAKAVYHEGVNFYKQPFHGQNGKVIAAPALTLGEQPPHYGYPQLAGGYPMQAGYGMDPMGGALPGGAVRVWS